MGILDDLTKNAKGVDSKSGKVMKSSSGEVLQRSSDPKSTKSSATKLVDQYNRFLKMREEQQGNTDQASATTTTEPAPDTTGWRVANEGEKAMHQLSEWGETISDPLGFGETFQKVKSGEGDAADVMSLVPRFGANLVGGTVGGLMMTPEMVAEALSGNDYQNMYDGLVSDEKLSDEQKTAAGVNAAINIASMIPGVGLEGTIAKGLAIGAKAASTAGKVSKTTKAIESAGKVLSGNKITGKIGKSLTDKAAKRTEFELGESAWDAADVKRGVGAKLASKTAEGVSSKIAGKKFSDQYHPVAGLVGSMAQEGLEEGAQSLAEQVRADYDSHGLDALTKDPDATKDNLLESAALGAIGGGVFHGVNTGVQYANWRMQKESNERTVKALKALTNDLDDAYMKYVDTTGHSDDTSKRFSVKDGEEETTSVIANALSDENNKKHNKTNTGFSGTLVGNYIHARGNDAGVAIGDLARIWVASDEEDRAKLARSWFSGVDQSNGNRVTFTDKQDAFNKAVEENDLDAAQKAMEDAIAEHEKIGSQIEMRIAKSPANNLGPLKVRLSHALPGANTIALDGAGASMLNADYDADLAQSFMGDSDDPALANARWLEDIMLDYEGNSAPKWDDAGMDIAGMSEQDIDGMLYDIMVEHGSDIGKTKIDSVADVENGKKPASTTVRDELIRISAIEDKDARHREISRLMVKLKEDSSKGGAGIGKLGDIWAGWKYGTSRAKQWRDKSPTTPPATAAHQNIQRIFWDSKNKFDSLPPDIQQRLVEQAQEIYNNLTKKQQTRLENELARLASLDVQEQGVIVPGSTSGKPMFAVADKQLDMMAAAVNPEPGSVNPVFRWMAIYTHFHSKCIGDGMFEDMADPMFDAYDAICVASYNKQYDGTDGDAPIARFLRSELQRIIFSHMGGKPVLGKDFSVDETFSDETIDEMNKVIDEYNDCIKRRYLDSEDEQIPQDRFLCKHVSRKGSDGTQSIEEVFVLACGDTSLSTLFDFSGEENAVLLEHINGVNMTLSEWLDCNIQVVMDKYHPINNVIKSDGTVNTDIGSFFTGLRNARRHVMMGTEQKARNALSGYTSEEIDGEYARIQDDLDEDRLDAIMSSKYGEGREETMRAKLDKETVRKAMFRLHKLLGWKNCLRLRLCTNKQCVADADFVTWLTGTPEESLNAAWNMIVRANIDALRGPMMLAANTKFDVKDRVEQLKLCIGWINMAVETNNPFLCVVANTLTRSLVNSGCIDLETGSFKTDLDEVNLNACMLDMTRFITMLTDRNTTFEHKMGILNHDTVNHDDPTMREVDCPWVTYALAGWDSPMSELGLSKTLREVNADAGKSTVRKISKQQNETAALRQVLKNRPDISDDVVMTTLQDMAETCNMRVDTDIEGAEFYGTMSGNKAAAEKAQSAGDSARAAAAFRLHTGRSFNTLLQMNTTEMNGSMSLSEFANCRKAIMWVVTGKIDPETGEKYYIEIYDPKKKGYEKVTQEKLLNLDEGQQATADDIFDFFERYPNVASWFHDISISPSKTASGPTAGLRVGKDDFKTCFFKQHAKSTRGVLPDKPWNAAPHNYSGEVKPWRQYVMEQRVLDELHDNLQYKVLIASMIPNLDKNFTEEQFINRYKNASRQLDEWVLYKLNDYIVNTLNERTTDTDRVRNANDQLMEEILYNFEDDLQQIIQVSVNENIGESTVAAAMADVYRNTDKALRKRMLAEQLYRYNQTNRGGKLDEPAAASADNNLDIDRRAKEEMAERSMITVVSAMLTQGRALSKHSLDNHILRLPFNEIVDLFPGQNQQELRATYDDYMAARRNGQTGANEDFDDIFDRLVLTSDRAVLFGITDGDIASMQAGVAAWFEELGRNGVAVMDTSWAYHEFMMVVGGCFDVNGNFIATPDNVNLVISTINKHVAIAWTRAYAVAHNKDINLDVDPGRIADSVVNIIPSVHTAMTRRYGDDAFYGWKRPGSQKEPPTPKFNIYNFVNNFSSTLVKDWALSAESALQIGMEGAEAKMTAVVAFLSTYECDTARFDTDGAGLVTMLSATPPPVFKNGRAQLRGDFESFILRIGHKGDNLAGLRKELTGSEDVFEVRLSDTNRQKVIDWLGKNPENPAAPYAFQYIDTLDSENCTCGCCHIHNPNYLAFMRSILAQAQEGRTMKVKKKFRDVEKYLKGNIRYRNKLTTKSINNDAGTMSAVSVYNEWVSFTKAYEQLIRAKAQDVPASEADTGMEDIDKGLWNEYIGMFAKTMVPCVTLRMKDGSSFSVGIKELRRMPVKNPLKPVDPADPSKGYQDLDWDEVSSAEMRIMGIDEWNEHMYSRLLDRQAQHWSSNNKPGAVPFDYAAEANAIFDDWSDYNRHDANPAPGASADTGISIDEILQRVAFASNSVYDPISLQLRPTPMTQMTESRSNVAGIKSKGHVGRRRPTMDEKDAYKKDIDKRGLHANGVPVSAYVTDKNPNTDSSDNYPWLAAADADDNSLSIADVANSVTDSGEGKDLYFTNSVVLISFRDYHNPATQDKVKAAMEKAARSGVNVVIDVTDSAPTPECFGLSSSTGVPIDFNETAQLTYQGGVLRNSNRKLVVCNPKQVIEGAEALTDHDIERPALEYVPCGSKGNHINFLYSPAIAANADVDSFGFTPSNAAASFRTQRKAVDIHIPMQAISDADRIDGIVMSKDEFIELSKTVDADLIEAQNDRALRKQKKKPPLREEKKDLGAAGNMHWDLRDIPEGMSQTFALKRVQAFMDKVCNNNSAPTAGELCDVSQGDVIAVVKAHRENNPAEPYYYVPVFFDGAVPVSGALVQVSTDAVGDGGFYYRYDYDENMARLHTYLKMFGDYAIKMMIGYSDDVISITSALSGSDYRNLDFHVVGNYTSMASRIVPDTARQLAKNSIFVLARNEFGTNIFGDLNEENIGEFFPEGTGQFNAREVKDFLLQKRWDRRAKMFWEQVADGNIKFAAGRKSAQTLDTLQQQHMGRLIKSCIRMNFSPAYLFQPCRPGTHVLESDWARTEAIVSTANGVTLDDVMAYANWYTGFEESNPICDSVYRELTEDEFMESSFLVDGAARIKYNWVKADPAHAGHMGAGDMSANWGYYIAMPYSSGGDVNIRTISSSASVNDQMKLMSFMRDGVQEGDPEAALRAISISQGHFDEKTLETSRQRLTKKQELKSDTIGEQVDYHNTSMENRHHYVDTNLEFPAMRKFRDMVGEHHDFYQGCSQVKVWRNDKRDETLSYNDIQKDVDSINSLVDSAGNHRVNPHNKLTVEDLMRLVVARIGWTITTNDSSCITWSTYNQAVRDIEDLISKGLDPLSTVGHEDSGFYIDGQDNRQGLSLVEPGFVISVLTRKLVYLDEKTAMEHQRKNLERAEEAANNISEPATKLVTLRDVAYFKYLINGETDFYAAFGVEVTVNDMVTCCEQMAAMISPDMVINRENAKRMARESKNRLIALNEAQRQRNSRRSRETSHGVKAVRERHEGDSVLNSFCEGIVKFNQFTTMCSGEIFMANRMANIKGSGIQRLGMFLGSHLHLGAYSHLMKDAMDIDSSVIGVAVNNADAQSLIEAMSLAHWTDDEAGFREYLANGGSATDYIKQHEKVFSGKGKGKSVFNAIYNITMRVAGGGRSCRRMELRNFLDWFRILAGREGLGFMADQFEHDLAQNPALAINNLFRSGSVTQKIAFDALEFTATATDQQVNAGAFFLEHLVQKRGTLKLLGSTGGGMPFFRSTTNITFRVAKSFIPGVSAANYIIVDYMQTHADKVFNPGSPLGRLLERYGRVDMKTIREEFVAEADAMKFVPDMATSILIDMQHLPLPIIAWMIGVCIQDALQPPEDDALYDDWEEWTLFGARIGYSWFLKDLMGPILPWACYYKAQSEGHSTTSLLFNSMSDFFSMSPVSHAETFIDFLLDPDAVLELYEDESDWYSDYSGGKPELADYLLGSAKAAGLSAAMNIITPKIIKELSTTMNPNEQAYNRVYQVDAFGQRINNEYGDTEYKTELTSFEDAQIRKLCRGNMLLAAAMDFLSGYSSGATSTGYQWWEMPSQAQYESKQTEFMHTLTVWDYDNNDYKNDDEVAAVCCALVTILDSNDDMKELYDNGWYLDSHTKDALSSYIWDLYQEEILEWTDLQNSGNLQYTVLGDGDYDKGKEIYYDLYAKHNQTLNYYKQTLYYDKLCSDDLNQGLIKYNRYNTTYKQDANGNWYATGQKQYMSFLSPITTAPTSNETTGGAESSWASLSALDGSPMYRENDDGTYTPQRALVPTNQSDNYQFQDFSSLGNSTESNMSTTYPAWAYQQGSGYGGYYSYGGGGGSYSSYGGSSAYTTKTYADTNLNRQYAHNVNFNRLNIASAMSARHLYTENPLSLSPNFETKGSRQAYRRSDF